MFDSFATSCYRIMLNVKRIDRITNEEIYNRVEQKPLSVTILKRQLEWVGHMLRRDTSEPIQNLAFYRQTHGMARRGRRTRTYHQHIVALINQNYEMSVSEIAEAAKDRGKWTKRVLDCIDVIT